MRVRSRSSSLCKRQRRKAMVRPRGRLRARRRRSCAAMARSPQEDRAPAARAHAAKQRPDARARRRRGARAPAAGRGCARRIRPARACRCSSSASATCSASRWRPSACSWASCCMAGWAGGQRRPRASRWRSAGCWAERACWRRPRSSSAAPSCCCARSCRPCGRCVPARVPVRRLTLALAAGMLGAELGPARARRLDLGAPAEPRRHPRRGALRLAHRLVQNVGVDILVVFLLLAGLLLLTGASLAGVIRATGNRPDGHHADGAQPRSPALPPGARRAAAQRPRVPPSSRPSPSRRADRAGHARGGAVARLDEHEESQPARARGRGRRDGLRRRTSRRRQAKRRPRGEDGEERRGDRGRRPRRPRRAHPAGPAARRRSPTTPISSGSCPSGRALLTRSTSEQTRPDTAGQERTAAQPGRGARALRRAGEGDRHRRRPAHHPLRAAPGARHQGRRRSPSSRTTSPTRWRRPTSASWRRSPASRRSASRCPTPSARWSASATSSRSRRRTGRR